MSYVILSSVLFFHLSIANAYNLDSSIKDAGKMEYIRFEGSGPFDSYSTMNLPYAPAADLFAQIVKQENLTLRNRGEAHITIVTPVEYWNILRPMGIRIQQVHDIVSEAGVQNADFEILCLGRGSIGNGISTQYAYYVVVESEDLINIRRRVQELYVQAGGSVDDFNPEHFYPHITLGFSIRDLHENDGVIKDRNSCVANIEVYEAQLQ
jgi:2'-5' RNA ligase